MYNKQDVMAIVDSIKLQYIPLSLKNIADTKRLPNSYLMSNYIEEMNPTVSQLTEALKNLPELNMWLDAVSVPKKNSAKLPSLEHVITYDDPKEFIAGVIESESDYSSIGLEEGILIAKTVQEVYAYPSGKMIPFFKTTEEYSSNISILLGGWVKMNGEIYIRENSVKFVNALFKAQKDTPHLSKYKDVFDSFPDAIEGVILAHEVCEYINELDGKNPLNIDNLEMLSEKSAKIFLEENGVKPEIYSLYHTLRASYNDDVPNISQRVLDTLNLN